MHFLLSCVFLCVGAVVAADAPPVADMLASSGGPVPVPGQWMEYRIAWPADPLEDQLSRPQLPPADPEAEPAPIVPVFEPPPVWQVMPLRLEITDRTADQLVARMRVDTRTYTVTLPLAGAPADEAFARDAKQEGQTEEGAFALGDTLYASRTVRTGTHYGSIVRVLCPDVPFGLARVASADVDLVLTAFGMAADAPPFPINAPQPQPPFGGLYTRVD